MIPSHYVTAETLCGTLDGDTKVFPIMWEPEHAVLVYASQSEDQ